MPSHTRLKQWKVGLAGVAGSMAVAFLMVIFLLCRGLHREHSDSGAVFPILPDDMGEQLSDEATAREMIISKMIPQMISEDDLDAILTENASRVRTSLASVNANERMGAIIILGEVGPKAAPFVPLLVDALDDGNPEVRRHAVYALGEIGPNATVALTRLREMAAGEHARVQPEAAKAISKILEPPDRPD